MWDRSNCIYHREAAPVSKAILEKVDHDFFIMSTCGHFPAVYDKVASRARGSIILVKVRNQPLLRDGYVRDQP